jgi:N-glycosylase/DNA lyase
LVSRQKGEFDLDRCVFSGQVFRWRRLVENRWHGVDGPNTYSVEATDKGYLVDSNADQLEFERLFRLESRFANITDQIIQRGPELTPYVESLSGLRLMSPSLARETLFSFLCTSNNHVARITKMVDELVLLGDSGLFPGLERLAAVSEAELRAKGFGYRGATIPKVAIELVHRGGEDYLESLSNADLKDLKEELSSLPGVGPKLTDCIALFAFGHTEVCPVDTHIWQACTRLYFPEWQGENLTGKRYESISNFMRDRFGDLAGWAQQCLFVENMQNWRSRK